MKLIIAGIVVVLIIIIMVFQIRKNMEDVLGRKSEEYIPKVIIQTWKSSNLLNKNGRIALDLSNTDDHKIEDDMNTINNKFYTFPSLILFH